jgi:cation diffusion facilitator CzcD-associated flavoprotein CzcO
VWTSCTGRISCEDLQQERTWSERFAPQAEILSYINHVADRFALRRHFRFNTQAIAANQLPDEHLWEPALDSGDTRRGRCLLAGSGALSTPKGFDVPGLKNFTGLSVSTSRWTISLADLAGKRGVVTGTGSSGMQCIPLIAEAADHLTLFQSANARGVKASNLLGSNGNSVQIVLPAGV